MSIRTEGRSRSICFVTTDFPGIVRNGGIGTYVMLMSRLLARAGWRVHVLFCGWPDDRQALREVPRVLAREGIRFHRLDELSRPRWLDTDRGSFGGGETWETLSQRVLEILPEYHGREHFDLVEFPDWGGLGFRSAQAKRSGLALEDLPLTVKLHGPSRWQREGNLRWLSSPRELNLEFCERYAFEQSDAQLSPSRYMVDYTREMGWQVRDEVVVSYPFPDLAARPTPAVPIRELVFFGRLERRKGLEIFLEALDFLPSDIPVLFLGRDTELDSHPASALICGRLLKRPYRIETELDRRAALDLLGQGGRLALIPSTSETFGFTVAECVAGGIPFLASRAGGIPEVLQSPEARERWLFPPTVQGLVAALRHRLIAAPQAEMELRAAVMAEHDRSGWNDAVVASYDDLAERLSRPLRVRGSPPKLPSITVAVAHFNHGRFLPEALASLANQSRPPDQVIVIDDGSDDPESQRVFALERDRYPEWTFLEQENAGPGAVRNLCLHHAEGEYLLPFDSDNVARPELVATMASAAARRPELAAICCHYLAFADRNGLEREHFLFRFAPLGGPLVGGCYENVYGDTCSLFRVDILRAEQGFETARWSPFEDYETFTKLVAAGHQLDVIPAVLFDYRDHTFGRLRRLTTDPTIVFRHRHRMIRTFLADGALSYRDRMELWETAASFAHLVFSGPAVGSSVGGIASARLRTPRRRIEDLRNLITDQRTRGKPPLAVAQAAVSAVLRRGAR
jgi:glycosyltransferase involved in cell wall biosynthesis